MLQLELMEKLNERIVSIKNGPRDTLIFGGVVAAIGGIAWLGDYVLGWWRIGELYLFPVGIAILAIAVFLPLSFLSRDRKLPYYQTAYEVMKNKPRSFVWAYKQNNYRRTVVISSNLVLCSTQLSRTVSLHYSLQSTVDEMLLRMRSELNPTMALGFTPENKKRFLM